MKSVTVLFTLCAIGQAALAAEKSISFPITASHERLVVALWEGDIRVAPGPADTVTLIADCAPQMQEMSADDQGLRSLRASATLPDIVSSDNVITMRTYEGGPKCALTLTAPVRLALHTRINKAGSIQVDGWRGALLAWSADGDVNITDAGGSLSATAMNGEASLSIGDAGIQADSAITAANGTLTLFVNPDRAPALRAQARWGDVKTDLDLPFDEIVDDGVSWFVTGAADDRPVLTLRNLNRDIVIRSAKP